MKRVRRMGNGEYLNLDIAVRAAWLASRKSGIDEEAIERDAQCSPEIAVRVAVLRRLACWQLHALFEKGALTFRQLSRIAFMDEPCLNPPADERQLELARQLPSVRRALGEGAEDAK